MGLVVTAPARANLIGNPSDQYGGCTLSCTLALRARVEIEPADEGLLVRGDASAPLRGADDLVPRGDLFDLPRAALRALDLTAPHCRIALSTEIPLQSGLAGSTAQLVALLHALMVHTGRERGPHALAEFARDVERSSMGIWCGFVDHYMTVFGGLQHVDFRGKARPATSGPEPYATLEPLGGRVSALPFVLAFTGVRHRSDSVHRPNRERWEAGEAEVVEAYERVAAIGLLGKRALLDGDWDAFGRLMNENHAIQRALGGSGPANERLIGAALAAGALGAKLAGAGDGGTVVALWPRADTAPLEAAWRAAGAQALYRPVPAPGVSVE